MKRFGLMLAMVMVSLMFANGGWAGVKSFVASYGLDTNPCTFASPCRSFTHAVDVTDPGGQVIVVDSAGYGSVTITKGISIMAMVGTYASVTPGLGVNGITINAGASDVVILRGLTITAVLGGTPAHGISFNSGGALYVENCMIQGFGSSGIFFNATGYLSVKETISRQNGANGIFVAAPSPWVNGVVDRVHLERNNIGLAVSGNAYVTVRDSIAAGNARGFYVNPGGLGPGELNIENCVATDNNEAIRAYCSSNHATIRVSNSTVTNNNYDLSTSQSGGCTASILSRSNNTVEQNTAIGSFTGYFYAK